MDLTEGSIGWYRARRYLNGQIEKSYGCPVPPDLTPEQVEYFKGRQAGLFEAYGVVRSWFNTESEALKAAETRRGMFG